MANSTFAVQSEPQRIPAQCIAVESYDDIATPYRGTPIEDLLAYHNLGAEFPVYSKPELLVGMCMDYRVALRLPRDFAYVLRAGGANLRGLEFHISMAVAQGISALCVIGHDQCAMCGVVDRRRTFVDGLVETGGWNRRDAENHFAAHAPHSDIGDVIEFVSGEAVRLSRRYPLIRIAPLFYSVAERVLYQVDTSGHK